MATVSVHEAKTHLSRLIERVLAGEEVIVARNREPVIKLVPAAPVPETRRAGRLKGKINIDDRFLEPLPDDELAAWNCED